MGDRPHIVTVTGISNLRWYRHPVSGEVVLGMLALTGDGQTTVIKIPEQTAQAVRLAVETLPPAPVGEDLADQRELLRAELELL